MLSSSSLLSECKATDPLERERDEVPTLDNRTALCWYNFLHEKTKQKQTDKCVHKSSNLSTLRESIFDSFK